MNFTVAPIVEGYGDVPAIRVLLNRLAPTLRVAQPVRQPRGKLVRREGLTRAVHIARSNIARSGAILVLFDADDDCVKNIVPELRKWLSEDFPHVRCEVVLAVKEFESWIVGGDAFYGVNEPDVAGNLSGRIRERHGTYRKTVDQPRHISRADLDRLRLNSRSFRQLDKVVRTFVTLAQQDVDPPAART